METTGPSWYICMTKAHNMKNFVALKLKEGVGYRVQETKWDRSIGDVMTIEDRKWVVIATGDRGACVAACNELIDALNEVTRKHNAQVRAAQRNRPLTEFERTVLDIINKYS